MGCEGEELTRVRIFSLDESNAVELPPRQRVRSVRNDDHGATPMPRRREETAIRHHAFLHQTMPPSDPLVLESERRRSGSDDEPDRSVTIPPHV